MTGAVSDIAFTAAVKAEQDRRGSRAAYARMADKGDWASTVDDRLRAFIAERDSFYLATASADGQPYIQHRGGPKGFLKMLDDSTLAFADFAGNRQYISIGNLAENNRVSLFLMDYANRARLKIWGTATVVEDDPELIERVFDAGYDAKPERVFVVRVTALDVNCPQHIRPRFSEEEVAAAVGDLHEKVAELQADIRDCCPEDESNS